VRGGQGTAVQCDTAGGYVVVLEFGSTPHPLTEKVPRAVKLVQHADPALMIDGRDDGGYGSGGRDRGRDGSIFEAAGEPTCWFFRT
jgi:hypothetical protein